MKRLFGALLIIFLLAGCAQEEAKPEKSVPMPSAIALNFENAKQMDNLKVVSGAWAIKGGRLLATGQGLAVLNNFVVTDSTTSVSITGSAGIAFRATSPQNLMLVAADMKKSVVYLYSIVEGKRQLLAKSAYNLTDAVHKLTVDVNGASVRAYVDDDNVIDFGNAVKRKGRVGLWIAGDAEFDDLSAENI